MWQIGGFSASCVVIPCSVVPLNLLIPSVKRCALAQEKYFSEPFCNAMKQTMASKTFLLQRSSRFRLKVHVRGMASPAPPISSQGGTQQ
jgi:hypothetical protein